MENFALAVACLCLQSICRQLVPHVRKLPRVIVGWLCRVQLQGDFVQPFAGVGAEEADEEKQEADKDVEPQRRHLGGPLAGVEPGRQPARAEEQRDDVAEKFGVEVEEILQRVEEHMPEGPVEFEVMLAAFVAERSLERGATVLAHPPTGDAVGR